MDSKKVFVATYYDWFSYGAVLQAMSFNHFLRENGYNAKLIKYQHQDLDIKRTLSLKARIKNFLLFIPKKSAKLRSERFLEENVVFTDEIKKYSDLSSLDSQDAVFISGSDQVWDPVLCSDFFFLRFVEKGKRISYAASMGNTNIPESNRKKFVNYLRDMEKISVRESDVIEILKKHGIQGEIHIDPVFLHGKEFWEKYEAPINIKEKYILLFPIYWDKRLNDEIKRIKKETGYTVYALSTSRKVLSDKALYGVTPDRFLYLINHAEKVITSSFHGTAFSIIFRKEFCAVIDPSKPSRIRSLLEKFGLESAICDGKIKFANSAERVEELDRRISAEQEKSLEYLREAILE